MEEKYLLTKHICHRFLRIILRFDLTRHLVWKEQVCAVRLRTPVTGMPQL